MFYGKKTVVRPATMYRCWALNKKKGVKMKVAEMKKMLWWM